MSPPTGAKIGRPTEFGPSQAAHWDGRQPLYNALRRSKASQKKMGKFLDGETILFFTVFGWNNPMRCEHPTASEPTTEAIEIRRGEACEAGQVASQKTAGEMHKERDELVKHVRLLMSARFQGKYDGPKNTKVAKTKVPAVANKNSSAGIQEILMTFLTKPTLGQLCKAWAKSRPGFETDVDRRLAEVRVEKGDPNYARIGLWNTMASEGYLAASAEEKEEIMKKAKDALDNRMEERRELLAEPKSMAEALRFMETSQSFLEDLMQFFADRCGGMAVMVVAGSGNVVISQGTCDIVGKPKLLYTDIEGEKPLLEGLAGRIHQQACLVTESKWGMRLSDHAKDPQRATQSWSEQTGTVMSQSQERSAIAPIIDELPSVNHNEEGGNDKGTDDIYYQTLAMDRMRLDVEGDEAVRVQPNTVATLRSASTPEPASSGMFGSQQSHSIALRSTCTRGSSVTRSMTDDASPEAYDGGLLSAGFPQAAEVTISHSTQPVLEVQSHTFQERLVNDIVTEVEPVDAHDAGGQCQEAENQMHVDLQAYEMNISTRGINLQVGDKGVLPALALGRQVFEDLSPFDITEYERRCAADGSQLEGRKDWWSTHGMTRFLITVPSKLRGRVNLTIGCRAVLAYLALELSNATDGILDLSLGAEDGESRPAYTAWLRNKPNITKTVWHPRAKLGEKRKPASLDADIGRLLTALWVHQQPESRRDDNGDLKHAANVSMNWQGCLRPGPKGIRLLLVTLLCWGGQSEDGEGERWNALAQDFANVCDILAAQGGKYQPPHVTAGVVDSGPQKRPKKLTEKAALLKEESANKKGAKR
ncbi:unnamed protein product [Peniophora sp. CBMAI 1063]|nr:unnamed protein product [Peniophora sp. CBMAI 1063]